MSETPILKCADGAVIGVALARIEDTLQTLTKDTAGLRRAVEDGNHRTSKIEAELLKQDVVSAERERWAQERERLLALATQEKAEMVREQLQSELAHRDKQQATQKWFIGTIIAATAVAMGLAERIINWVS